MAGVEMGPLGADPPPPLLSPDGAYQEIALMERGSLSLFQAVGLAKGW